MSAAAERVDNLSLFLNWLMLRFSPELLERRAWLQDGLAPEGVARYARAPNDTDGQNVRVYYSILKICS